MSCCPVSREWKRGGYIEATFPAAHRYCAWPGPSQGGAGPTTLRQESVDFLSEASTLLYSDNKEVPS